MHKVVALGGSLVTRICEGQFGITRREWAVMAIVSRTPEMQWAELRVRSELDDARLSRAVSSLVDKGLARKASRPNRQICVSLTENGRRIYEEIFPIARDINMDLLREIGTHATETLDTALVMLHRKAEQLASSTVIPKTDRGRQRH
jgi:DNA-binding MarR family transcriptional regulator